MSDRLHKAIHNLECELNGIDIKIYRMMQNGYGRRTRSWYARLHHLERRREHVSTVIQKHRERIQESNASCT